MQATDEVVLTDNAIEAMPSKEVAEETYEGDEDVKENEEENEEEPLFQFLTGMVDDLKERLPLYMDDWGMPKHFFTVFNATIYAFIIQLIPALIFAELMSAETENNLATAEVLLSSGIMGIIYAVFAGQPLTIMGITGPVAILLGTSYKLTEQFDAEYFPFFFWVCLWAGLMHMISAMVGLVSLVWKVTPFTTEIFELFIGLTFVFSAVRELVEPIRFGNGEDLGNRSQDYATLLIGLITMWVAWTLHFAETWSFFNRPIRVFLTSYNTILAVAAGTVFSYLPGVELSYGDGEQPGIQRVNVKAPWDWQPTADRDWIVNPFDGIDAAGILAALIPGLMFFLLFIIDHNVSSIMTQNPKLNLKKPPAYHWDFFILGITFLPCAFLGIPPGNGLIPQAPLHARALCTRRYLKDDHGVEREIVIHCEEQRWSGLGQALLMFVALAAFRVVGWIPRGCLFGLFLYLGIGAFYGNEIWERIQFSIMQVDLRPQTAIVRNVPWNVVMMYTGIQFALAFSVFAVAQFASVGYIYPALLFALVPVRSYILHYVFEEEHLKYLDPVNDGDSAVHQEEQELLKRALLMEESDGTKSE